MCKQFYATKIFILDEDAKYNDHDGKLTVFHKKGVVFCMDNQNNYYRLTEWRPLMAESRSRSCWPEGTEQGIQLWRDAWNFFSDEPETTAPYFAAFFKAQMTTLT